MTALKRLAYEACTLTPFLYVFISPSFSYGYASWIASKTEVVLCDVSRNISDFL